MEKRTFSAIAYEISELWVTKYGANFPESFNYALPYLRAMMECETTNPNEYYMCDKVGDVTRYFLANAANWRGEDAKRLKAELKSLLK